MTERSAVLCIGSALWDVIARSDRPMKPGYDVPGRIDRQLGGVALNVALALARQNCAAALLTALGRDDDGDRLVAELEANGVDCCHVTRVDEPTDSYLAIESKGEVFGAVADCNTLESAGDIIVEPLRNGRLADSRAPWRGPVVIDGNLSGEVLFSIAAHHDLRQARIYLVPASPGKAERMRRVLRSGDGTIFVNIHEAEILCQANFRSSLEAAEALVAMGSGRAIVTNSSRTACLVDADNRIEIDPPPVRARTATGAGDAFLAGFIAAENRGETPRDAMQKAVRAAADHISRNPA
ncbi:MAG: PfkB family carbohydrate kinase [Paracoccaceae bacterium]